MARVRSRGIRSPPVRRVGDVHGRGRLPRFNARPCQPGGSCADPGSGRVYYAAGGLCTVAKIGKVGKVVLDSRGLAHRNGDGPRCTTPGQVHSTTPPRDAGGVLFLLPVPHFVYCINYYALNAVYTAQQMCSYCIVQCIVQCIVSAQLVCCGLLVDS